MTDHKTTPDGLFFKRLIFPNFATRFWLRCRARSAALLIIDIPSGSRSRRRAILAGFWFWTCHAKIPVSQLILGSLSLQSQGMNAVCAGCITH